MEESISVLSPLVRKAYTRAAILHKDQKRKTTDAPLIIHQIGTAFILIRYTNNEEIIAAAFLHDTLEDVPGYSLENLIEEFGEKIARIVKEVSEEKDPQESQQSKKETWRRRKEGYLAGLEQASYEALMVCCADKIDNLFSLLDSYKLSGKSILEKFNAPPDQLLWFYQSVFTILAERLDNDIVDELEKVLLRVIQRKIFN